MSELIAAALALSVVVVCSWMLIGTIVFFWGDSSVYETGRWYGYTKKQQLFVAFWYGVLPTLFIFIGQLWEGKWFEYKVSQKLKKFNHYVWNVLLGEKE